MLRKLRSKMPMGIKIQLRRLRNEWLYQRAKSVAEKNRDKRIFIFDTAIHGNIGDQAILLAEYGILDRIFPDYAKIDIPMECVDVFLKKYRNKIRDTELVCIQGGGFLGSLWHDEEYEKVLRNFSSNPVIVFPQTVFYEDDEYGEKRLEIERTLYTKSNLKVFCREERSFRFTKEELKATSPYLVPDIVLSYKTDISYSPEKKMILCFRSDKEKVSSDGMKKQLRKLTEQNGLAVEETDMSINRAIIGMQDKKMFVDNKLRQLALAKFVVTDRLHCMIFCTLVGTPCIAMDNSSKKVKGVYEKWLKDLDYIVFCENENDALSKAQEWIKADSIKATRYSPKDLESAFAPLTQAIKDCLA